MERLIGKKALVFADVRLKVPKWFGQRFEPGGMDYVSVQHLLKTTSGDPTSIGRKYNPIPWEGRLPGKVWMAMNRVPNFNDTVLPTRFVKVAFEISFLGRQDNQLLDRLKTELSGIAGRCVAAYHRARDRGRLIQPRSAERLEREIAKNSDPFTLFVQETFIADPAGTVPCARAFGALQTWCALRGRQDLLGGPDGGGGSLTKQNFKSFLKAIPGFEAVKNAARAHGEPRRYAGFRFLRKEDRQEEEED
jgi:putative DNA primase/helicase